MQSPAKDRNPLFPFNFEQLNEFKTSWKNEKPILIDEEQVTEKFSQLPTIPVFQRPTRFPVLMKRQSLGTINEIVPQYV